MTVTVGWTVATRMAVDEASCAELAVTLAVAAGELIREAFETSSNNAFELKTENDHVTAVDLACERLILDGLRARFPSHQFIGEEPRRTGGVCGTTSKIRLSVRFKCMQMY